MASGIFGKILEAIDQLPTDEQVELVEVVRRRLAQRGRLRVVNEVAEARSQFTAGGVQPASVSKIMREIESL